MFLDLGLAAAGQQRDEIGIRLGNLNFADAVEHGMADPLDVEFRRDLGEPRFLERKNGQEQIDVALHGLDAARPRGPDLRADVVDDARAGQVAAQLWREAEIEAGAVDQDDGIGPFPLGEIEHLFRGICGT